MMHERAGNGPEDLRRGLIEKSAQDEGLRRRLLEEPKGTVEEELGASLPEGVEIRIVEETPETVYPVLPPKASASRESGELSDRELEAVAGGWGTHETSGSACQEAQRRVQ